MGNAHHARAKAAWKANGALPAEKPMWLRAVGAVTQEHWAAESADFRAELHAANERDYELRLAAAKEANEKANILTPTTPEEYES